MKDLNKKICLLRALHNYTQVHVAKEIGVSTTAYIGIEKDASSLSIKRLESIISFYGMTLQEFFSFSDSDLTNLMKGKTPAIKREFYPQLLTKLDVLGKLLEVLVKHSFIQIQSQNGQRMN